MFVSQVLQITEDKDSTVANCLVESNGQCPTFVRVVQDSKLESMISLLNIQANFLVKRPLEATICIGGLGRADQE